MTKLFLLCLLKLSPLFKLDSKDGTEQPCALHHCSLAPTVLIALMENHCNSSGSDEHLAHSSAGPLANLGATVTVVEQSGKAPPEHQRKKSSQRSQEHLPCQCIYLWERTLVWKVKAFQLCSSRCQQCITKILKWKKKPKQPSSLRQR